MVHIGLGLDSNPYPKSHAQAKKSATRIKAKRLAVRSGEKKLVNPVLLSTRVATTTLYRTSEFVCRALSRSRSRKLGNNPAAAESARGDLFLVDNGR